MNEVLTCKHGHTWTRECTRGRKPICCPIHLAQQQQAVYKPRELKADHVAKMQAAKRAKELERQHEEDLQAEGWLYWLRDESASYSDVLQAREMFGEQSPEAQDKYNTWCAILRNSPPCPPEAAFKRTRGSIE